MFLIKNNLSDILKTIKIAKMPIFMDFVAINIATFGKMSFLLDKSSRVCYPLPWNTLVGSKDNPLNFSHRLPRRTYGRLKEGRYCFLVDPIRH